MTSRELVMKTLEFKGPQRVPRQLWSLPWAEIYHESELEKIREDYPDDFIYVPGFQKELPETTGDAYEIGEYIDEWGCRFTNRQRGLIGEIKNPLIKDEDWEDAGVLKLPEKLLDINSDKINEFCKNTDKFVLPSACPRIFERLQFIRGTEQLYMDLVFQPKGLMDVMERIHDFFCRELTAWADTDVDALTIMDDWGSQRALLINPELWVKIFKPMYRDYINIAHKHGKKIFMHLDGHILDIIPHLIDLGLDAVNSQLFCMGLENLKQFKGHITFWGEIDRQYLLPKGTKQEITDAVKQVKESLWQDGGCIAQCEFGAGANPDNVYTVFETWNNVTL